MYKIRTNNANRFRVIQPIGVLDVNETRAMKGMILYVYYLYISCNTRKRS